MISKRTKKRLKKDQLLYDGIKPKYKSDNELDLIYEFVCDFGYEMSDEEKKLQTGDPELFGQRTICPNCGQRFDWEGER